MQSLLVATKRPLAPATLRLQSDERLTELTAGGFEPAFELLVSRHRTELLRYCKRILGEDRAEDVVQRTFIRAYEVITAGAGVDNLRPWLFRVAHNCALDALKDRALQHVELDDTLNGVERPDQIFERSERLRDVVAAVQALPSRQRDAIVLRELEGRSYDEIARELAATGGAVRQLLTRARTTLRAACTALTPYGMISRVPWGSSEPVAARVVEVVGGTGAPVVVAQICAAAIVTCVGAGAVAEQQRQPDAERAGLAVPAEHVVPPVRTLLSVPTIAARAPAGQVSPAVPRLVPPDELPARTDREPAPTPQDPEHTIPVKKPSSAPLPEVKSPGVAPQEPSYEFAYPVGLSDPQACLQRRRARSSACEGSEGDPSAEEQPTEPEKEAPPADPPPGGPPPADPPSAAPPAAAEPPPGDPSPESTSIQDQPATAEDEQGP